jgi:hypothetical protein
MDLIKIQDASPQKKSGMSEVLAELQRKFSNGDEGKEVAISTVTEPSRSQPTGNYPKNCNFLIK